MLLRHKRSTHNGAQRKLNEEKRLKSERLIGKQFTHQGRVCKVVRTDRVTGDAIARVGRNEQPFHPDQVQQLINASAAQG